MRHPLTLVLLLGVLAAGSASSQEPPKSGSGKSSATKGAKSIVGKLADTAVTSAAAMATDTILGDQAGMVAAALTDAGPAGMPTCPDGLVPYPVASPRTPSPMAVMPTPGSAIVGAAKKKISGDTSGSAPAGAQYQCGTAEQAAASAQGSQAQGASMGMPSVGSLVAATPQGMLVTGAIAAAPAAGKGLKKLGGMLGRGKQSGESMAKDLAKGRLQLKAVRFVDDSDELEPGFEPAIEAVVEALQGAEGRFLLLVPAEANAEGAPDTALAARRLARVAAHLQLAGVSDDRLTIVDARSGNRPSDKMPKRGSARVELVRVPVESSP
jgi:outer membrane protein OmpA-like peptidoglycan-associated protein